MSPEPSTGAARHSALVAPAAVATGVLCLLVFANNFALGAFSPLLPDIARAHELTDRQVGVVAAAFGFARMVGAIPAGALAGWRLGFAMVAAQAMLAIGVLTLAAATGFATLVLGRLAIGLAHTLSMVAGLTAVLRDHRIGSASFRLNVFEFAGMLGVLGGLALVVAAPRAWSWNASYLLASAPVLLVMAAAPAWWRRFGEAFRGVVAAPASQSARGSGAAASVPPVVAIMFAVGMVFGLAWSAASQFVIPLRGARELGLDRGGVSSMLAVAQVVDIAVLLPVGTLADRIGKQAVLGGVALALGLGVIGIGVGSLGFFVLGCAGLGLGLAGWMLPLGVIREHTPMERLAWRTGLYRLGVDSAIFVGPLVSGMFGERRAGVLVAGIGLGTIAMGLALLRADWRWRAGSVTAEGSARATERGPEPREGN